MPQEPCLTPSINNDSVFFDRNQCVVAGQRMHTEYISNNPFPHIAIKHFLPLEVCRRAAKEFPKWQPGRFNDKTSQKKTGYQMEMIDSAFITNLMNAMNSSQFLSFIEETTGIKGLIPDPHFLGGGLHETLPGGYLSVHADFNTHTRLHLVRRLNIILFLNENWKVEYGGCLELWDKDVKQCMQSVSPDIGTAVIFNTDAESFHGQPDPLACPDDMSRRSIALYYYTASEGGALPEHHTTDFRARPGHGDEASRPLGARLRAFALDWTPPAITRVLGR